jgi:hypothetical protein
MSQSPDTIEFTLLVKPPIQFKNFAVTRERIRQLQNLALVNLPCALSNKENARGSPGSVANNIDGLETGASCLRVIYL